MRWRHLFSVVWHWNDTIEPQLYLNSPAYYNLTQMLSIFEGSASLEALGAGLVKPGDAPTIINQLMAASLLTIIPILLL